MWNQSYYNIIRQQTVKKNLYSTFACILDKLSALNAQSTRRSNQNREQLHRLGALEQNYRPTIGIGAKEKSLANIEPAHSRDGGLNWLSAFGAGKLQLGDR